MTRSGVYDELYKILEEDLKQLRWQGHMLFVNQAKT